MTLNENKIVLFHGNMALWCAINSHGFSDYCESMGIDLSVNDICKQFYNYNLREQLNNVHPSQVTEHDTFCQKHLIEEQYYKPDHFYNAERQTNEWSEYNSDGLIESLLLSHLINQTIPGDILLHHSLSEKLNIVLSFCDKDKAQRILFDGVLSLIFDAILSETDSLQRVKSCQLLYDVLKEKITGDYLDSYDLFSLLEQLNPDVCRSFFSGLGIDKKEHDALTSFIRMGRSEDALREIFNLRNNDKLGIDSRLIEFCAEFKSAQKENIYLDWHRRFSIDKKDLPSINTALIQGIKKHQLISLDVVYDLVNGICPELNIKNLKVSRKKKQPDSGNEKKKRSYSADILFLPNSAKNVDKEKLIQVLMDKDKGWIKLPLDYHPPRPMEELYKRLNYFFRGESSNDDDIELPCDNPENFHLHWTVTPKGKLLNLLVRLLYNQNPDATAKNVIIKKTTAKAKAGINNTFVDHLNSDEPIWPIVEKVFNVGSARDCKIRGNDNETEIVKKLEKLAADFFSCKKSSNQQQ